MLLGMCVLRMAGVTLDVEKLRNKGWCWWYCYCNTVVRDNHLTLPYSTRSFPPEDATKMLYLSCITMYEQYALVLIRSV